MSYKRAQLQTVCTGGAHRHLFLAIMTLFPDAPRPPRASAAGLSLRRLNLRHIRRGTTYFHCVRRPLVLWRTTVTGLRTSPALAASWVRFLPPLFFCHACTPHVSRCAPHAARVTLCTARRTCHEARVTLCTPHVSRCARRACHAVSSLQHRAAVGLRMFRTVVCLPGIASRTEVAELLHQ